MCLSTQCLVISATDAPKSATCQSCRYKIQDGWNCKARLRSRLVDVLAGDAAAAANLPCSPRVNTCRGATARIRCCRSQRPWSFSHVSNKSHCSSGKTDVHLQHMLAVRNTLYVNASRHIEAIYGGRQRSRIERPAGSPVATHRTQTSPIDRFGALARNGTIRRVCNYKNINKKK